MSAADVPTPAPEPHPDPVRLLLKAVDALPAAEREVVLAFLLERGLGGQAPPAYVSVGSSLGDPGARFLGLGPVLPGAPLPGPRRGEQLQTVPVRFPVEQHARLRDWCGEHGFSMAVVVRGLVEQFLERQSAVPSPGE